MILIENRKIDLQSNLFNRRVASGHEVKAERTVSVRMSRMLVDLLCADSC